MSNYQIGPVELLIFQSTSFCNLDCKYCYLPDRNTKNRIDIKKVAITFQKLVDEKLLKDELNIVWHAGEPMVVPIEFYEQVNILVEEIIPKTVKVNFHIQTNATLINEDWCDFFIKSDMQVGVSLDGPKHINDRNRILRNGKGSFDQVMNGVNLLIKNNIPFSVIAVLTDYSLDFPEEIYEFFRNLDVKQLGFNMDEEEGVYKKSTMDSSTESKLKEFWKKIFELQLNMDNHIRIREIHGFTQTLIGDHFSNNQDNFGPMTHPLSILSIDTEGNFSTFSPELLGMKDAKYGDFNFGNILDNSFRSIVNNDKFKIIYDDILNGLKKCYESCEYFSFCGGGAPSNKLYENGTFNSTETKFCKYGKKILVDVFLNEIETDLNIK
jgi:uncharacterized protein